MIMGCCPQNGTTNVPGNDYSSTVEKSKEAVVALVERDEIGLAHAYCAGVWVDDDKIITAFHCVRNDVPDLTILGIPDGFWDLDDELGKEVSFVVQDEVTSWESDIGSLHQATVIDYDKEHDLALLVATVGYPGHETAPIAHYTPVSGQHLNIIGHPSGVWWTFSSGYVSAYRDGEWVPEKAGPLVQVTGPVWFGNSGGGAFDDEGNLVGIASFLIRGTPEMSFFIAPEKIDSLLRANQ